MGTTISTESTPPKRLRDLIATTSHKLVQTRFCGTPDAALGVGAPPFLTAKQGFGTCPTHLAEPIRARLVQFRLVVKPVAHVRVSGVIEAVVNVSSCLGKVGSQGQCRISLFSLL